MPNQKPARKNAFEEADEIRRSQAIRPMTYSEAVAMDVSGGRRPSAAHLQGAGREVLKAGHSVLSGLLNKPKDKPKDDEIVRLRRPMDSR